MDDSPSGAGGAGGGGNAGSGGGKEPGEIGSIEWSSCPERRPELSCAKISVPIDWSDASSERLDVFLRKWTTQVQPRRGQLWLLQGGPGSGAEALVSYAPYFAAEGFDVYLPDYRGVGRSTPLACADEEDILESTACMDEIADRWGDRVRFFSSADAATDIGMEIEALRGDDEVFALGVSYGTFVLNRLLSLFPDLLSGAVLDSICSPTGCAIHQEADLNRSAERVFGACGADPGCRARLSSDPWARLEALMGKLKAGHCSEVAGEQTPYRVAKLLESTLDVRRFAPAALALTYRLDRCDPEDIVAIRHYLDVASSGPGFTLATHAIYSQFIFWNLYLSEFWDDGLTPEALLEEVQPLVIRTRSATRAVAMRERWNLPTWPVPDSLRRWADVSTPVLLLNGDLDFRTPARDLAGIEEAFSRPHQTWIEVPWGGHGVILEGTAKNQLGTCGFEMIRTFLANTLRKPATSCLAGMDVLDVEGDGLPADYFFGTSDLWENGVSQIRAPRAPDPAFDLAWQRLRERFGGTLP